MFHVAQIRRRCNLFELVVILLVIVQIVIIYHMVKPSVKITIRNEVRGNTLSTQFQQQTPGFKEEDWNRIRKEISKDEFKFDWWNNAFTNKTLSSSKANSIDISSRPKFDLVLIVSTAPQRFDRREAIRKTWWQACKSSSKVKCLFFTDGIIEDEKIKEKLLKEHEMFNDIHVQPLSGGVNFGQRFLYHMRWATVSFDYEYFMRLDDDEFLCFENLLQELSLAPKMNFIWSWIHCEKNAVRPEESFIVISQDLVKLFLLQDKRTIQCHPLADQQIGVWVHDLKLKNIYYHERRIHHHPPASQLPEMTKKRKICHEYLALHGSYPKEMYYFWDNRGDGITIKNSQVKPLKAFCKHEAVMHWNAFSDAWKFEPKPCLLNPQWNTSILLGQNKKFYAGREEETEPEKMLLVELEQIKSALNACRKSHDELLAKYNALP